jgi:two-component system KDP operon response regulator KdpE
MAVAKVLVIDDDPSLLRALRVGLQASGHQVTTAVNGEQGISQTAVTSPDVVVLDLGLPDLDGQAVCRRIRQWSEVPIIILSASGSEDRKVAALDGGADDYVTKPFGMDELLARMRAVSRRVGADGDTPQVRLGDLVVDLAAKRVVRRPARSDQDQNHEGNGDVRLTPTEWHLLEVLLRNPGKLLSQQQLLAEVWGPGYADATGNLRLYMTQLRRKLEPDPARPRWLMTEPGMGYRYQPEPHDE